MSVHYTLVNMVYRIVDLAKYTSMANLNRDVEGQTLTAFCSILLFELRRENSKLTVQRRKIIYSSRNSTLLTVFKRLLSDNHTWKYMMKMNS